MRMSWSFTGNKRRTGYLSTDKGSRATYEYEISPTLLQRNLMHLRNHPNDLGARSVIPSEMLADLDTWFAQLPETWWVNQAFFDRHAPEDVRIPRKGRRR